MPGKLVLGQLTFDTSQIDKQLQQVIQNINAAQKQTQQQVSKSSKSGKSGVSAEEREQLKLLSMLRAYTADLTKAQNEYVAALKSGNTALQGYWKGSMQDAERMRDRLSDIIDQTDQSTYAYQRFNKILYDSLELQTKHADTVAKVNREQTEQSDAEPIRRVKDAIEAVTKAYREYLSAQKAGDTNKQNYWGSALSDAQANYKSAVAAAHPTSQKGIDELRKLMDEQIRLEQQYRAAISDTNKALNERSAKKSNAEYVGNLKKSVKELEEAYRNLIKAMKDGDAQAQSFWQSQIDPAKNNFDTAKLQALGGVTDAKSLSEVMNIAAQAAQAENQYKAAVEQTNKALQEREQSKSDAADAEQIRNVKAAMAEVETAYNKYIQALKNGNAFEQDYWQGQIDKTESKLAIVGSKAESAIKGKEALAQLTELATKARDAQERYKNTVEETNKALDKAEAGKAEKALVQEMDKALKNLQEAYQNYNTALKQGNEESAEYWNAQIEAAKRLTRELIDEVAKPGHSDEVVEKFTERVDKLHKIELKGKDAVAQTNKQIEEQANKASEADRNMGRMVSQMERWVATMVVMRGLRQMWQHMTDYASSYYDAMNEIRIVTMMTAEEANALGASYRDLAAEMSVSSTEIAKAAVEYWRQGLGPEEVENRLKYTTVYAKISAMDFAEAATLMTAATNSMGLSADRVADVWAYLGDASASGADEIGTAMQKVAAVAETAGIKFEWLGAYIATLSEKTRQAPEIIGTAMNSMISRLQQIRQKGFNSEDVYGINDIAKALGALEKPIALMDEATGEWRDFPDILIDIAAQWDNLTDKEQAYIATTMGGTKQRNLMLTLLNDMAKGAENGSRAWKLYTGAQNAAGVAMEKYAIYEESVAAAQGRLNAALEELYAMLSGDMIKGWYDTLTDIVTWINNATEATDGWNIKIGLAVAGISLQVLGGQQIVRTFTAATASLTAHAAAEAATGAAATAAAGGVSFLNMALMATVAGVVVTGIVSLIGVISTLGDRAAETAKRVSEQSESLATNNANAGNINKSIQDLNALRDGYKGVTSDVDAFLAMRDQLISQYPELQNMLHTEVDDVGDLAGAYDELSAALDRAAEKHLREQWAQAHAGYSDAVKTLNEGRAMYTGVASAQSLYQLRNTNGDLFQRRVADSNLDQWGINQLREAKTLADEYIAAMQDNLNRNWKMQTPETRDQMQQIIDEWVDYTDDLTAIIYKKTTDADKKIADSVRTLITNAINPDRNSDITGDIPHIVEVLMGKDWVGENGYIDVGYVETQVDVFLDAYRSAITRAKNEVAQMVADFKANGPVDTEMEDRLGNVLLKARKVIDTADLVAKGWGEAEGDIATLFSQTFSAGNQSEDNYDWEYNKNVVIDVTPILPDGTVLTPGELEDYIDSLINSGTDILSADSVANGGKGLVLRVSDVNGSLDDAYEESHNFLENLHEQQAEYYESGLAMGDAWIDGIVESLRGAGVSDDRIVDILSDWFDMVGMTRDAALERIMGSGEESEGSGSGDIESFEEKLERAFGYLERLQVLRDAIADTVEEGGLTKEILDSLSKAFGPEFLEELINNSMEDGELDLSRFIEGLKEALENAHTEEGDALLAMLGLGENTEDQVEEAMEKIADAADVEALAKIWEDLPDEVKQALGDTGKEIEEQLAEAANDADSAADRIEKSMARIRRNMQIGKLAEDNKVWSNLADIIDDLTGTVDQANGAIGGITEQLHTAAEAAGALEAAAAGDEDALEYLANLTGLTADILANDLTPAELQVALMGDQASASMEYLANWLYQVGAIQIDTSGNVVALGNIQQAADAAGMTVANLASALAAMNGAGLTYQVTAKGIKVTSRVPSIKWSGGSKSSKKSGGGGSGKKSGGGGGGGGSSNDVSDIVEALVDAFDRAAELRDHRRELAQQGQGYHEARGEIQGVIAYLEIEKGIVEEDTAALEQYVASLEAQIEANREVVQTQAAGSKAYNQAMIDLDKLQEEHQKYSQQLIKNKTDIENLTQAIDEQNKKIRQMEIDLRNTILEAIEDRESAEERKLGGRIEMEEIILDLIKKRYEAERDEIIETQNARKDALEEELDQIDELLAARKKLADQEDKMQEIAKLEEQISRITADPTRQKEAMQLREKLAKLREDMAWDTAEEEAKAQKDSIKKQITSIEDYIKYVEDYYEELFRNPQELIAEMQEILTWTDEQIIEWLKSNEESYATSTEATQKKMVKDWQSTLDDMRDAIRTHWDEVEQIIAGGADNIINFLTTYSQKYREAGKLQAEAYVDEWKQQLRDLENAYKQVQANISSYDYVTTTKVNSSGGSGGGGGGGGSGGGVGTGTTYGPDAAAGKTVEAAGKKSEKYAFKFLDANGKWVTAPASPNQQTALNNAKHAALSYWSAQPPTAQSMRAMADINSAIIGSLGNYIKKYAHGGLSTSTGLAWLDGTQSRPERILSAHQTELFEDMISTLHAIRSLRMNTNFASPKLADRSMLPNIENITVNVASLDSNADYEDAAEKMMNAFYEKVSRGRAVGGIQSW